MTQDLPTLQQFIKQLQQVPYLASKNLYRVAHYFLEMEPAKAEQFIRILTQAQAELIKCTICWVWKERSRPCSFCDSSKRDQELICVVESWYDVQAIEKIGSYQGVYHVLGGAIFPLEGIGPEQLTIGQLKQRIMSRPVREIILAMNQTPEGEATAAYIARVIKDVPCLITCLARGIPVGAPLEFVDRVTMHKALMERRAF